jgi:hypothetical protein
MRGHSESAAKSMRNGEAWKRKRKAARESRAVATHRLPAWVEERGGKLELIPSRAAVVKHIFHLAAAGYGYLAIIRRLTEEGVPAFGEAVVRPGKKRSQFSGQWTLPYVARLLNDRRAVGEFQPCGRGRKPEGDPIPGYFPAAVTEDEYWAAQAGADVRRKKAKSGKDEVKAYRVGKHVNLFSGLLRNARDGDTYIAASKPNRVLVNHAAQQGRGRSWSFSLPVFERALLKLLHEINPHDILNGDHGPDKSLVLAGELARVEAELSEASAFMDAHGFSATIGKRVTDLEARKAGLAADLAEARIRAAHPLSETWGECQSLLAALENAPDPMDARIRLRAALRRIVDSIWLLVVPRGQDRLCAIQVWFAGGKRHRDYLVLAGRNGPPLAGSLADVAKRRDRDLRQPDAVLGLEEELVQEDLEKLKAKLKAKVEAGGPRAGKKMEG